MGEMLRCLFGGVVEEVDVTGINVTSVVARPEVRFMIPICCFLCALVRMKLTLYRSFCACRAGPGGVEGPDY